ncbi:hypothetical protein K493DRAFT_309146 [Basidiobolus meristosporus CBS 931.73]|uniref:Arrestin C-terminal-like domain-containing protein n=1 Tax=Basidiobolus meristosporus CBS 931.73 TaxID=1314790 RepID=A0A1Y1WQB0_9FUNG|nr:hypothetical protein K493DRAFT_309146 [Basidiobolus meristosporus CBS 931.73]|eukprot:ORX75585.1 hypothetical protein K493DRAFT_309146 [Basidiobolus meristosporus CBS 931.73]
MHKNTLRIHLIEDPVILHGSPDDSVGRILSGHVSLTLAKPMSVKCISLRLKGKVEFHRIKEIWEKVTIVDRTWTLLRPGMDNYLLDAKTHMFPFEFALRGNLPDSVNVAHCRVSYRLTSVVERPLFWNIKASRVLRIQRTCSPLVDQRYIPHSSLGVWAKSLYYNISLEKGSFTPGELIPVSFKFLSQTKEYYITEIIVSIREVASYTDLNLKPTIDSEKIYQKTFDSRLYPLDQGFQVTLPMPTNIHCDCSSDIITVSHLIVAKIRLMDAFQRRWYFYINVPFVVQSHAQHELSNSPPSYESPNAEISPPPYQRVEVFCH